MTGDIAVGIVLGLWAFSMIIYVGNCMAKLFENLLTDGWFRALLTFLVSLILAPLAPIMFGAAIEMRRKLWLSTQTEITRILEIVEMRRN